MFVMTGAEIPCKASKAPVWVAATLAAASGAIALILDTACYDPIGAITDDL